MTSLVAGALGIFFAFAIYIASLNARRTADADDFLDGGGALPSWSVIFAGGGVVLAGLGLHDHFLITALYGLQYSHVALGFVLAAACAVIVQKRLWFAARSARIRSPIELLGAYYGSITIRLFALLVLFLFAVPFAASSLGSIGDLVAAATGADGARAQTIWAVAFFLFLFSVIGGWRGVVHVVAAQSFLFFIVLIFVAVFAAATFDRLAIAAAGIATPHGVPGDKIPGVLQYVAGLGKQAATGGLWTTTAILSFALSLTGVVLSPAFAFLGITARTRSAFAFSQVWIIAGLAGGMMLLIAPLVAGEIAALDPASLANGAPSYGPLVARFARVDRMAATVFVVLLIAAAQITVCVFAAAGANTFTLDVVARFMLPDLTADGRCLAARIALAIVYAAIALAATFAPAPAALVGTLTLSLSVQLLPAFLGLCWAPWISRSAVITGLIAGILMVVFTEPAGLIAFEALFVPLPWGRWPLTIHSAAWGLVFNVAFVLLVSIVTRAGPERDHREILHRAFRRDCPADPGGRGSRTAKWSLSLIWTFFSLGPGAIIGNDVFRNLGFADTSAAPGVASLWVWQIVFWFLGVWLVWWLADREPAFAAATVAPGRIDLGPIAGALSRRRTAGWIGLLLSRLSGRHHRDRSSPLGK